jgi:replicative DNA helicase
MRITSTNLELRILRTLTSTKSQKRLARLTNVLNPACFYSEIGSEVYSRVMTLARERGILVNWQELLNDPVLRESSRKYLQNFKKSIIRDRVDLNGQIKQLHSYRQLRAMYFSAEHTINQLKRDRVDPDKLYLDINQRLSEAKSGGNSAEWFTHIGQDDKASRKFVRSLLNNKIRNIYIPTGITAFDRVNVGIPRGSFWLIGSNTSGGKSALANQVGGNMAEQGARVCVIQLEMNAIETGQRQISRITSTAMNRVIDPTKLSVRRKRLITRQWMQWHQRIKRRGGLLSIFVPQEDLTAEEILLILQPFNYDVMIFDYIGLLKGVDDADYPRLLGRVARLGKRFAGNNNCVVAACAQLTAEHIIRYSRAIQEHAQNMWTWVYGDKEREFRIAEVRQPKSRNQRGFNFLLREDFRHMRFVDIDDKEIERYRQRKQKTNGKANGKTARPRFDKKKSKQILQDRDFADLDATK